MQRVNTQVWKSLLIVPLGTALLVAGCGDGHDRNNTVTPLSGKVVQGPVSGATVFADLDGDRQLDAGEVSADGTTGTDGSYTFSTPPAGDYVLVTEGGTDELTQQPAYPSLAPKGAKNITPLTTLVALAGTSAEQEAVKAILDELAGAEGYDIDLSQQGGVPAQVMKVAKSVEGALKVFADLGVHTAGAQRSIIKETAKQLVVSKQANPAAPVDELIQNAVAASAAAIATDPTLLVEPGASPVDFNATDAAAFAAIVKEAVAQVQTAIDAVGTGVINETKSLQNQLAEKIKSVITDNEGTLSTIVKTVKMSVAEVRGYEGASTTPAVTLSGASLDAPVTVPSSISVIEADLSLRNDFNAVKSYSPVTLTLMVDDNDSSRQVIITVTGLSVEAAAATGGAITVDDSAAKLNVVGRTASGDWVTHVAPFTGPFESIVFDGNAVQFDLEILSGLLSAKSGLEAFADLSVAGNYTVTLAVGGAPATNRSVQLTIQ